MNNPHRPQRPETDLSLPPMVDAAVIIAVLALSAWLPDAISKGLGL